MNLKRQLFLNFILLLFVHWAYSQSLDPVLISAAGGHFDAGNASLSWSLGEPVISTEDAGSQQLTQGFHQTFLNITAVSDIGEAFDISVFPNPSSGELMVDLQAVDQRTEIEVYDALGRLLLHQLAASNTLSQLDIKHFSSGHYYLRVYNEASILKVFKIQKL